MAKRRLSRIGWRKEPWFRGLCKALLVCKSEKEMGDFLRDIGTLSELQAWSERLEVARLLIEGRTYRTIAAITGASTTTVTRVSSFLEDGEGGYQRILKSKKHRHTASPRGEKSVSVL
jgi:TrpR-related protein YerC/YecD